MFNVPLSGESVQKIEERLNLGTDLWRESELHDEITTRKDEYESRNAESIGISLGIGFVGFFPFQL